jgi:pyridoxine/pyridoxamine 5'-phosphate oxidase
VSQQSAVISSLRILKQKWEERKRHFAAGEVPLPLFLGDIRVVPAEFEFWPGHPRTGRKIASAIGAPAGPLRSSGLAQ